MARSPFRIEDAHRLIGREVGVSKWFTVGQDRIDRFSDATDDHYWLHVGGARASAGPFGRPIAHGFLTLSLLVPAMYDARCEPEDHLIGFNYGLDKVRFLLPVKAGDRVRTRFVLDDVTNKGEGRYLLRMTATMELEGSDKPALVAEWLNMYVVAAGTSPPSGGRDDSRAERLGAALRENLKRRRAQARARARTRKSGRR